MDIFSLRQDLIDQYSDYVRSFVHIRDARIRDYVREQFASGAFWPSPLVQLNPSFLSAGPVGGLEVHPELPRVFARNGEPLNLHQHQQTALQLARAGRSYVVTTGTGSGKSLTYLMPVVDHVLRHGSGRGIQAIVVYPMNALANSQMGELKKFLEASGAVTFRRYTGQESRQEKDAIIAAPPDILLTNYMMLELMLTRQEELPLIESAQGLKFIVFDELHTYRGRQGADVALLIRRLRERTGAHDAICVGTSATMSSRPRYSERQQAVAEVASKLFGVPIAPAQVIGETLQRVTVGDVSATTLRDAVGRSAPEEYQEFIGDPLVIWLETRVGLCWDQEAGRYLREDAQAVSGPDGLAEKLATQTGLPPEACAKALEQRLLTGNALRHPDTGRPVFAFRLHQFISKASTVYAPLALGEERARHLTLQGQVYAPDTERQLRLYPLEFCRNCGQEYASVRRVSRDDQELLVARGGDAAGEPGSEEGYLYLSEELPWPADGDELLNRVPEHWLEEWKGGMRVKSSYRSDLPASCRVTPLGELGRGLPAAFVRDSFKFCLACGVSYVGRTGRLTKLATLSSEGRSTATTLLTMAGVNALRRSDLPDEAQKVLSFTDNRQDASLQAGHFNDFVFVASLRAGLAQALQGGPLTQGDVARKTLEAMGLDLAGYAADPAVRFSTRDRTVKAAQNLIGHALFTDLAEGKRLTMPNLEGVDLVRFGYPSLREVCEAEDLWEGAHPALHGENAVQRRIDLSRALLDWFRQNLAISTPYLDPEHLDEMLRDMALIHEESPLWMPPEEVQRPVTARHVVLASVSRAERRASGDPRLTLNARGAVGKYVARTLNLNQSDTDEVLRSLVAALGEFLTERGDGYQLEGTAFTWEAGPGAQAYHDALRVVRPGGEAPQVNSFFLGLYRQPPQSFHGLRGREHTAQIRSEDREQREEEFRNGQLNAMFCSPTMELGVDISDLNVVHLRNIPPTPANYAQRSGRAGRSGQPALVLAYASTGNNHDQYFFRRPGRMVGGRVSTPRIELANEPLVRAHVHAVWLAETREALPSSLAEMLDMEGNPPSLAVLPRFTQVFADAEVRRRALERAQSLLEALGDDLARASWYDGAWLPRVLDQAPAEFDRACERWRDLYRSALSQMNLNHSVMVDAGKAHLHDTAKRLHREASNQLDLLRREGAQHSDFSTYRYLASEGFLPGYNFARLPLMAYIPARRHQKGRDNYLPRPRFLALSEFGPGAIIYHNGAKYEAHKVIVPARGDTSELPVLGAQRCEHCGYLHHGGESGARDLCEHCGGALGVPQGNLFRMTSVATRRRERIGSDEEERRRVGYEVRSAMRFASRGGRLDRVQATAVRDGEPLLGLTYGDSATLWRINYGWRNRKNRQQLGFLFDPETSRWIGETAQADREQSAGDRGVPPQRVVPFVEDTRNVLLIGAPGMSPETVATLMSALKHAAQLTYQLEDSELGAELLPSGDEPRQILLYEASEGGAGVLGDLLFREDALAQVAKAALELLHFGPDGEDCHHAPHAQERCAAACYDCLMTYSNQNLHDRLDRFLVRDLLLQLSGCEVSREQTEASAEGQTELEARWLQALQARGLRTPPQAHQEVSGGHPDFLYPEHFAAVFVGGEDGRLGRDASARQELDDGGWTVIVFGDDPAEWPGQWRRYPGVFGEGKEDSDV